MKPVYLVLTQAQFDTANKWVNNQNGWPDGRGTERYSTPLIFSQYSNCPAQLTDKVGLVFDKALVRHIADALGGETRKDKLIRVFRLIKNNITNPVFVSVESTGGVDGEDQTADFTNVTADTVEDKVRDLIQNV